MKRSSSHPGYGRACWVMVSNSKPWGLVLSGLSSWAHHSRAAVSTPLLCLSQFPLELKHISRNLPLYEQESCLSHLPGACVFNSLSFFLCLKSCSPLIIESPVFGQNPRVVPGKEYFFAVIGGISFLKSWVSLVWWEFVTIVL